FLAIGEFPMSGHRFDAKQVGRLNHVGAARGVRQPGALPGIAAVEQQRALRSYLIAQPLDQGFQLREAAELAEAASGFFEIKRGERISIGALRLDAEPVEEGAANKMRWLPGHCAEAKIDARFAKIAGQELRMRIGDVQNAGVAEAFEIVNPALRAARSPRQAAGERCGARYFKNIPAGEGHDWRCAILFKERQ